MKNELDGIKGSDGGIKDIEHPQRKLYWVLTEACNLKCGYCYYNTDLKSKHRVPQRTLDEKVSLIGQFPGSFDEVIFTGGEALLDRNLPVLIEEVKKKGLKVDILTNGLDLTEERIREFADLGVDCISISLDSLEPSVNDQLRGGSEKVLTNIDNLLTLKPKDMAVEIMTTVTQHNLRDLRQLVDFCKEKDLLIWLDPVEINGDIPQLGHIDLTKMNPDDHKVLEQELTYWAEQMDNSALLPYSKASMQLVRGNKPDGVSCAMGTDHFVLEVDGSLHPCFSRSDINYGNVYESGLSPILENASNNIHQESLQAAECVRLGCVCMTIVSDFSASGTSQ